MCNHAMKSKRTRQLKVSSDKFVAATTSEKMINNEMRL